MLLVEDDPAVVEALAPILEELYDLVVASDGEHALDVVERERPDVLLLDMMLPRRSGPAVALEMARQRRGLETIPIVLYSASERVRLAAAEIGTPYYLRKPFGVEELLSVLSRALDERRAPQPPDPSFYAH